MKKYQALLNPNLEAFIAVANHKSVHAAARAIHISQTAMTQRILNLEHKLKTTLFIRNRQGMQLTSEGEKLLRYSNTVMNYSNDTLTEIMNAGTQTIQRVKIAGPSSIMISRIIPINMMIMKQFPMLYISFNINDQTDPINSLREGSCQFSILKPEFVTKDMESKLLQPEKYLLVCTSRWKKRKLKNILQTESIIDFDESDQTSFNYLKQYKLLEYAQPDRLFVNRTDSLSKMLIDGYGYGVLTKEFSKPLLEKNELIALNSGKAFDNFLKLAWFNRPEPPKYFMAIINSIN